MSRATYVQTPDPSHGDRDGSKKAVLRSFSVEALSEQTHFYDGDHTSRPNTPSMTNGSSRSNSSSIITCGTCGNSGNHCACSDSEKVRVLVSEDHYPACAKRNSSDGRDHPTALLPFLQSRAKDHYFLLAITDFDELPEHENDETDSEINTKMVLDGQASETNLPAFSSANPFSSQLATEHPLLLPRDAGEYLTSDSEGGDYEDDSDGTDELEEDNGWSGQDTNLETVVLNVVGDDLPLAAHLIPILHRLLRSEFATNAAEKLRFWRNSMTKSAQGTSANEDPTSTNYTTEQASNPRKRQRHHSAPTNQKTSRKLGDAEEGEDDDDDEDPQESKEMEDDMGTQSLQAAPLLACPFHKRDPTKYGTQHGDIESTNTTQYRSCGGPGWKSMQRLKEHLKRKHYPVQCDRCYHIFPGQDRAACVLALQRHRQLPDPCERGPDSGKEGISEAQWANLDKKKSSKKSQPTSRIDSWMEYWVIIFPGIQQPETPWYDNQVKSSRSPQPEDVSRFAEFFRPMLNLKISQDHIRFLEGQEDVMRARVEHVVLQAFQLYWGLNGSPSTTNSSSSRSNQHSSLLGGSYQRLSTPRRSRGQLSSSNSRSTAAYSMEVSGSPRTISMASRQLSQGQPTRMVPPLRIMPQMTAQSFASTAMPSPIPNEQQSHEVYHSAMVGDLANLGGDMFTDNGLGTGVSQWELHFSNANPEFYDGHQAPNLIPSDFRLDLPIDPTEEGRVDHRDFGQYHNPRTLR